MIFISLIRFLFLTFLITACQGAVASGQTTARPNAPAQTQTSKVLRTDLQARIIQIASSAGGRVGVAAMILETKESVSLNPQKRFPMQSVYKLPIGMAVLRQVDAGKLTLTQPVGVEKTDFVGRNQHSPVRDQHPDGAELSLSDLLKLAVSESDGTASDVLLRLIGGPEQVGQYLRELKINDVVVADTEKAIGLNWETQYRNWASPAGALALLRSLHEGRALSPQSSALLLQMMKESPTGPRRLKGLLPPGAIVAHKTGTSGTAKGITAATNDIGLVTLPNGQHVAVAIFVSDSPADEATREAVIAKIAKAVWDEWGRHN